MYVDGKELLQIVRERQRATNTSHEEVVVALCDLFAENIRLGHSYISNAIATRLSSD